MELPYETEISDTIGSNEWKYYIVINNNLPADLYNYTIKFQQKAGLSEIYGKNRLFGQDYLPSPRLYSEHSKLNSETVPEYIMCLPTIKYFTYIIGCLLYTSPSPRDS